LSNELQHKAVY